MPPIKGRMINQRPAVHPMYSFKSAFSGRKNFKPKATSTSAYMPDFAYNTPVKADNEPPTVVILDDDEESAPASCSSNLNNNNLTQAKRPSGGIARLQFRTKQLIEVKFNTMIWDVAFLPSGNIVVSHANGASLCSDQLEIRQALDNVRLGGGVATFADGRIAVVCRFFDTVNIFSPSGTFQKSFPVKGGNPASVAVNNRQELLVCDIGQKCVYVVNDCGQILRTIPTSVDGCYTLQWPEHILALADDSVLVCDVHQQCILRFNAEGVFVERLDLRTFGNQKLLRPLGLCHGLMSMFYVVDGATECVEAFTHHNNNATSKPRHVQTVFRLATAEETRQLPMKAVRVDVAKRLMLVGGLTGVVRLLQLVKVEPIPTSTATATASTNNFIAPSFGKALKPNANRDVRMNMPAKSMKAESDDDVIVLD